MKVVFNKSNDEADKMIGYILEFLTDSTGVSKAIIIDDNGMLYDVGIKHMRVFSPEISDYDLRYR